MRKLYLIAGHGAGDSGAVGNGHTEAERVRALAARIKALGGSNVTYLDPNRNWYADAGINSLSVPKDAGIVELHMDSGSAGARGGHVIIKAGYSADDHDRKLASAMARIFPGRSNTIVGRGDLANVNRAARRGINYRLVENGFISNAGDVKTFNSRLDEIARAYLDAFGIPVSGGAAPTPTQSPSPKPSAGLTVDGLWGTSTTAKLQQVLGTVADGVVDSQWSGWRSQNPGLTTGWRWTGDAHGSPMVRAMQKKLKVGADGLIGPDTIRALQRRMGAGIADGHLDLHSPCVKELQRRLNRGTF